MSASFIDEEDDVVKCETVFGLFTSAVYTNAVSSGLQLIPPNQAKSVHTGPCLSEGRTIRLAKECPLFVHISNTFRLLSDSPFADGTFSSTRIAILDPVGEGIRAFTLVGISIGGEMKGGFLLSFCLVGRGMLYMN